MDAGAKAAAEARIDAKMVSFMVLLKVLFESINCLSSWGEKRKSIS